MVSARKRLLLLIALLPVVLLVGTLLYMLGMERLEDEPRDFWRALEFAAETITTTGYGADSRWSHPAMIVFVIALQFFGVVLIYMVAPIYLIQFLGERFEARLPRQAPKLKDHVVIYRYGPPVESLIEELERLEVPLVIAEHDRDLARELFERPLPVVLVDPASPSLESVHLMNARALIANGSDEENAAVVLVARQAGFEGDVMALVEDPFHRKPISLAGADAVFTPRHVLGAALAARASHRISPRVSGIEQLRSELQMAEIRIDPASELAGRTLAEAGVGARTGAIVIGQWVQGHLEPQTAASKRLEPRGLLVAVGSAESLERLGELAGGGHLAGPSGPFVIGGYGEVGKKLDQLLRDAGEEVRVIDLEEGEGVDLVGNVMDPALLEAARVGDAQAVILALDNDRATLFATVILKDLAPEVTVIARVNAADNVERIHRAGADFALSISQVSGQILAERLLGRESRASDPRLRLVQLTAPGLDGHDPAELGIRDRTGASVCAVERGGEMVVELDDDFRFGPGDAVFVCGTRSAIRRFRDLYDAADPSAP